jgi:hypothetical protein
VFFAAAWAGKIHETSVQNLRYIAGLCVKIDFFGNLNRKGIVAKTGYFALQLYLLTPEQIEYISKDGKKHEAGDNDHSRSLKDGNGSGVQGLSSYHLDYKENYHSPVKNGKGKQIHNRQGYGNKGQKIRHRSDTGAETAAESFGGYVSGHVGDPYGTRNRLGKVYTPEKQGKTF